MYEINKISTDTAAIGADVGTLTIATDTCLATNRTAGYDLGQYVGERYYKSNDEVNSYLRLVDREHGSLVNDYDGLTERGSKFVELLSKSPTLQSVDCKAHNGNITIRYNGAPIAQTFRNMVSVFPATSQAPITQDERQFLVITDEQMEVAVKAIELIAQFRDTIALQERKLQEQLKAIR